jgi:elongation factor P hydroxylase
MGIHDFDWLQEWYKNQCDGDWEHEYGIKIETVDNPGWYITINLIGTEHENIPFEPVNINNGSNEWFFCVVRNKNFEASCDPKSLTKVITVFREWVSIKI